MIDIHTWNHPSIVSLIARWLRRVDMEHSESSSQRVDLRQVLAATSVDSSGILPNSRAVDPDSLVDSAVEYII